MTGDTIDRRVHRLSLHSDLVQLTMAVHAPAHAEAFELPNALHRFDRSVTCLTFQARPYMRAMVEVDEIGQVVYLHPLDRSLGFRQIRLQVFTEADLFIEKSKLLGADEPWCSALHLGSFVLGSDSSQS